jgi:putative drug exporter of the RND superfamily
MHRFSPPSLAAAATRHPWRVVTLWVAVLVVAAALIATLLGDGLTTEQRVTGEPEGRRGLNLLERHLPDREQAHELVVVSSDQHRAGDPQFTEFVGQLLERADDARVAMVVPDAPRGTPPDAPRSTPPPDANLALSLAQLPRSEDGRAVLVPLMFERDEPRDDAELLREIVVDADREPGFAVDITGDFTQEQDINELSQRDLEDGELKFGLPIALVILLVVFGTVVGAALPLLVSLVAIISALGLAALVAQGVEQSVFIVNMVSGMGLALGVDYALFVLSRYREERDRGELRDAAIAVAGATASRAVLFSGMTFVVALCGMLLVPTNIMRSLALGAILVGITAVAAALTLLPALLRLFGDRVESLRIPGLRPTAAPDVTHPSGFWARLVRGVMRRPLVCALAVTALLLAATVPLLRIETGGSGISAMPADLVSRQGYDALQEHFPAATVSPARVVVHADDVRTPEVQAGIERLREAVAGDRRFGEPELRAAEDGRVAVLNIPTTSGDPLSSRAVAAVRDLRTHIAPAAFRDAGSDVELAVTGLTALNIDYFDVMEDWLPRSLAFVLGLSFLLLMLVFRSIVVPLKAIVLNLLSAGATYGILVLVVQEGVGNELLGLQQVEVLDAWIPLFLFSVLFGLSMDYHMFLLTRIREHWAQTGDTVESVVYGVSSTGRLITGAALIIVAVFAGFARGDLVMFQQMGFGIAVALLIDATLVRGVLLPAAMALLGDGNWYLPRWLQWLPELQLEGDSAGLAARTGAHAGATDEVSPPPAT